MGLSFSWIQLTNTALKSLNQSLAVSEQRCTNPRSGKEAAGKPQLSRDEHHLLRTCYKGQIIHLILPLPTLFSCQLTFQEPLVQRAANYSRNSNWFLLRQRSNRSKPPAMRVGVGCLPQPPAQGWEDAAHPPNSSLSGQKLPENRWGGNGGTGG